MHETEPNEGAIGASIELRVPFHDVDALRVVWHGHYYKYMELARTELLRSAEIDADFLERNGLALVVVDSRCRHTAPLRYDDRVRVTAKLLDVEHRLCIAYEITNLTTTRRAARGRTTLVTLVGGELQLVTPEPLSRRLSGSRSCFR